LAVACIALVACSKQEVGVAGPSEKGQKVIISVSAPETKIDAAFSGDYPTEFRWEEGDHVGVKINGKGDTYDFKLKSGVGSSTAEFESVNTLEINPDDRYSVEYPYNKTVSIISQVFVDGNFNKDYIKFAMSDDDETVPFYETAVLGNSFGGFCVRLRATTATNITQIQFTPLMNGGVGEYKEGVTHYLNMSAAQEVSTTIRNFYMFVPAALCDAWRVRVYNNTTLLVTKEKHTQTNFVQRLVVAPEITLN